MRIVYAHNLQRSGAEEEAEFDTPATVAAITGALRGLGHQVEPLDVGGPLAQVVAALEDVGASFLALPPYSPDLSPIEPCGSKGKQHLRKAKARTVPALDKAVAEALALITADDARGWFQMCGLCVH